MSLSEVPYPAPLRGNEIGTWANDTVIRRLPEIARRVLAENNLDAIARKNVARLIDEIPHSPLPFISDDAPDVADWQTYLAPYHGQNWLDVPWYFAEAYFYRRIIEAVGYFQAENLVDADPFRLQKERGLESARDTILHLCEILASALADGAPWAQFARLMRIALWGNRADLSLWPAGETDNHIAIGIHTAPTDDLLIDDTFTVVSYLQSLTTLPRIDFLIDNAGFELVTDLALADFLLSANLAKSVVFHLKAHPTFVSDAMPKDIRDTLAFLDRLGGNAAKLSRRLSTHLSENRWQLQSEFCWNAPLVFRDMPAKLRQNLSAAQLVISKGDANYRRLIGDCHWPFEIPFADVVSYFPAPIVALRTFKSEVAAGLSPTLLKSLSFADPAWLTNGKRGVIQFSNVPK